MPSGLFQGRPLAIIPRLRPKWFSSLRYFIHITQKNLSPGNLAVGVDEDWSDDDLGIEDDDEFQKKKAVADKKKRQAEKVGAAIVVCFAWHDLLPTRVMAMA